MRTLFWAFVLLIVTVYIVGVLLRQTVGEDRRPVRDSKGTILFGTVGWSMFTVFRCFTGGCSLQDGTPLEFHLYNRYGWGFAAPYTVLMLCVTFGLFNLIMAIFVENVNQSASQKRQLSNDKERTRVCRNLRDLIMKFGGMDYVVAERRSNRLTRLSGRATSSLGLAMDLFTNAAPKANAPDSSNGPVHCNTVHFEFGGQITRELFQLKIEDVQVQNLLDDLDIHVGDRGEIFDVVDTEGIGMVDISDMIAGLLKLRSGGADKSDIVATNLAIRSLRKRFNALMERVLDAQVQLQMSMESCAELFSGREGAVVRSNTARSLGGPARSISAGRSLRTTPSRRSKS